jgi:hypothetical protein
MTTPPHPPPAGDQEGIATVEFTAVVWLFLLIVLGAAQFGLWWHVQHVVLGAAQDAARLVAAEGAVPPPGSPTRGSCCRPGWAATPPPPRSRSTAALRSPRSPSPRGCGRCCPSVVASGCGLPLTAIPNGSDPARPPPHD